MPVPTPNVCWQRSSSYVLGDHGTDAFRGAATVGSFVWDGVHPERQSRRELLESALAGAPPLVQYIF